MRLSDMARKPTTKQMAKVTESRFGFKIDYDKLTLRKAYQMAISINEGLQKMQKSHGIHKAEKNPAYMELLMVRESIHSWMGENRRKFMVESEMAKSEAILAAKDMVDSVQDMLEKISKMQNEQLPALLDTVRDQIGQEQGDQFKNSVSPVLMQLAQQLQQARESVDSAARGLAGEQQPQDMGMGGGDKGGAPDLGIDPTMGGDAGGMPGEEGDGFGATDAAAGAGTDIGREVRESTTASKNKKVTDKKTGKKYDPTKEFDKAIGYKNAPKTQPSKAK